ncbi:MAG: membrane protein [Sulfuricurvum sp. PC08-66]|nr:MAG: membrane protein [Sulfuricurvum sp. PC08-66]
MKKDWIGYFRLIGFIEGISYLVLLFIAMPLKYWAGYALAVSIVGMAHGVLFVLFMVILAVAAFKHRFGVFESGFFFAASLVPFGTFVTDARLEKFEEQL